MRSDYFEISTTASFKDSVKESFKEPDYFLNNEKN